MFLEDQSSITPKCSHSDSPPQNHSAGPYFLLETSTFGCWVVLRVTGLSTQSAAAGVTGMEKLTSLVTAITPPHILEYSPSPSFYSFSMVDRWSCFPKQKFSAQRGGAGIAHPSSSTPLVPQVLFTSLFLSLFKKEWGGDLQFFQVCILPLSYWLSRKQSHSSSGSSTLSHHHMQENPLCSNDTNV